jgi:hypothetical protein
VSCRKKQGSSKRGACGLIGMYRLRWRYRRRERNRVVWRARLREVPAGYKFRMLDVVDLYTREARIEPSTLSPGLRVVRVLESLWERRGTPRQSANNGTELTSRVMHQWAYQNQVAPHLIERGKPTHYAFLEGFNRKFRDGKLEPEPVRGSPTRTRGDRRFTGGLQQRAPAQLAEVPRVRPRDRRPPPRRSFPPFQRGQVRMCRNLGVSA